jgi:GT2 family glycosyltransferase
MEHFYPFISVIIPTHDRVQQLTRCLRALSHQIYPPECFEVIIVDDGGTTEKARVDAFSNGLNLTFIIQSQAGPAAARNAGAKRARGTFLAFTDDDCMPNSDWLQKLAARFAESPTHIIGGRTLNALRSNVYSAVSQAIIDNAYSYYNAVPNHAQFFASNNLAIPAKGFRSLDGFDTSLKTAEDRDLCDRWLHSGYQMTYAPETVVYHAHALTLRAFCRQHFAYGRGAFRYHRKRARRWNRPVKIETSFYLALLHYPLKVENGRKAPLLIALLLIWFLANGAGFVWEWWSVKRASTTLSTPKGRPHTEFVE